MFVRELDEIIHDLPIHPVALGYTPFAAVDDIPWAPKGRYDQMKAFLIQHGDLAHHMMKGTCATQVSFDFEGEQDCSNKMRLSIAMAPLTTAMFANSPIVEGKFSGFMSYRAHIWTRTDPARTGMPEAASDFSFERWVDYLLDVPMMFIKPGKQYLPAQGMSFRQWLDHGIDGVYPTMADWDLHMTQVFPEVRVKKQIEVRGADCVSTDLGLAFCALFRGLFYCKEVLRETLELTAEFASYDTREARFEQAARHGLQGTVGGRPMLEWAREVVTLGGRALDNCAPEDRHLLEPLEAQVDRGECPGRGFLRAFEADPTPRTVFEYAAYRP
jgi:glutamate--cysteine ligase